MNVVRLGAVGYLNARPLVFGLDRSPRFAVRYDVPSTCATLLHERRIDLGLIPSIEYVRGDDDYRIVPDLSIASRGAVASVVLYTKRPVADIGSIAMDSSSRSSVAMLRVLCARLFRIDPVIETRSPDLARMLERADAALIIGDNALTSEAGDGEVEKIDLGEAWTGMTGLPFVYAFWAGRDDALSADGIRELQQARDRGVTQADAIAREYFGESPTLQDIGARYLRDNIKYYLGADERAGLELFYRYAAEAGVVPASRELRFYR